MSRTPAKVTQADVARIIRAAKAAWSPLERVLIPLFGFSLILATVAVIWAAWPGGLR